MSTLFITHDMGTVAEIADRISVMYGGRIAESGSVLDIFDNPKHPYTIGLLNCLPHISTTRERLTPIPGAIPDLIDMPEGCAFYPRCARRLPVCETGRPNEVKVSEGHTVMCYI
jgi:oligopeptide/dipeptide ABC transporter ATP-binding protein